MAELHGRVLRFQSGVGSAKRALATHANRLLRALCALALCLTAATANADAITVDQIETLAGDLRSGDEPRMRRAVQELGHLPERALPAIEQRLERTRRQIVPEEDGYDALRYFRHAVGSRRADDMVDIAPGIPAVLLERPTPDVGRSAERLLLLRSLEAIGSVPAQRLMGDVLGLTPTMWRWERRRLLERMGRTLLPGLLSMKRSPEPDVRRWARSAIRQLGLTEPGRAVQEEDPQRLAGILDAYSEAREMDAMSVIISFVGHNDDRVRSAAREAMNRYGRNGIWQLREAMRNQLGVEADHDWGWQRTARELYEGLDAQRLAPVTERLNVALEAARAGDMQTAREGFDAVLMREPMHPARAEMAEYYARFAEAASDRDEKEMLLQRAIWLAPEAAAADRWSAQLLQVDVERHAELGFVDEAAATEAEAALASSPEANNGGEEAATSDTGVPWLWILLALVGAALALRYRSFWTELTSRATRHRLEDRAKDRQKAEAQGAPATRVVRRPSTSAWKYRLALTLKGLRSRIDALRGTAADDPSELEGPPPQKLSQRMAVLFISGAKALQTQARVAIRFLRTMSGAAPEVKRAPRKRTVQRTSPPKKSAGKRKRKRASPERAVRKQAVPKQAVRKQALPPSPLAPSELRKAPADSTSIAAMFLSSAPEPSLAAADDSTEPGINELASEQSDRALRDGGSHGAAVATPSLTQAQPTQAHTSFEALLLSNRGPSDAAADSILDSESPTLDEGESTLVGEGGVPAALISEMFETSPGGIDAPDTLPG